MKSTILLAAFTFGLAACTHEPVASTEKNQVSRASLPLADRYQIVSTSATGTSRNGLYEYHAAFLVDSASGRVWQYYPPGVGIDGKVQGPEFLPIEVSGLPQQH